MAPSSNNARSERLQYERKILEKLVSVMHKRLDQILDRERDSPTDEAGKHSFSLAPQEQDVLLRFNNSGMIQGIAAGAFSLCLLRLTRASLQRRLQTMVQKASTYPQQPVSVPPPAYQPPSVKNSPFAPTHTTYTSTTSKTTMVGPVASFFGWTVDLLVSFSVAATASLVCTDTKAMLEELSNLPKLSNSRISDELCPVLVQAVYEMQYETETNLERMDSEMTFNDSSEEMFTNDNTADAFNINQSSTEKTGATWKGDPVLSEYLASILKFSENCQISGRVDETGRSINKWEEGSATTEWSSDSDSGA